MADFDFDELDRAVSSAIGGDTPRSEPTPVSPRPAPSATPDEPQRVAVSSPPAPAPALRRSSGRFMDVVHPSSDMRHKNNDVAVQDRPAQPAPPETPELPPSTVLTPAEPTVVTPEPKDPFAFEEADWAKPLESPFIPNAVVEKRPLGGEIPSSTDFDAPDLLESPVSPAPQPAYDLMPDPIDFAESLVSTEEQQAEDARPVEPTLEETLDVVENKLVEDEKPGPVTQAFGYGTGAFQETSAPVEKTAPLGATSITQQYTEQLSSSDENGSIYDTTAYHQPLSKPAHRKSGAWVILWIVLLIILGGGAGAAVYFFVLPLI